MKHILAIDWGTKRIGLARKNAIVDIVFPIGYIHNTGESVVEDIASLVLEKSISVIYIGIPLREHMSSAQKKLCDAITKFGGLLKQRLGSSVDIEYKDEHYSSVQAGATLGDFTKHQGEDVVAAMKLLES